MNYKNELSALNRLFAACVVLGALVLAGPARSQTTLLELRDLSAFRSPGKSWQLAGDVAADLAKENKLTISKGTGVLVNLPGRKAAGKDLLTNLEHGDVDIELDYMMAKGSNSGIYLQGLYEVQLADSWGETKASSASNGGIYERWDESRPQGQQGFQGYAPRQNVSRAPGLWQHLKISFQAPRFDASGRKTENAKLLRVELNGIPVQENVVLFGPTRGASSNQEVAKGPLRIQGDHGAVAFRNIKLTTYSMERLPLTNLTYTLYPGRFDKEPAYATLPPEAKGPLSVMTSGMPAKTKEYLIRYTGTLHVKTPGAYTFNINTPGGYGMVKVNNQQAVPMKEWNGKGTVTLPAGEVPLEVVYSKSMDWAKPALALYVSGPSLREYLISDKEAAMADVVDPILVDALEKPILRSFMDLPDGQRVTHAVSVGSPAQVHYTYDADHGALVQVWRGQFLDATPMWHERGDGSARALGAVQHLGKPALSVAKLPSEQAAWVTDTTGSAFRQKGYSLNAKDEPTFKYRIYGAAVQDAIHVLENGQGLQRSISIQNPAAGLYVRLAQGKQIGEMAKGLYQVDDKTYYVRLDDAAGAKPIVRTVADGQELLVPVREKLTYSILF
ncbi:family 16 glycoside hydrolase [Pontibacter liquoris]|uniref:family 16 glycoside hydrolase n=1 Tax=Pontibacter liquoris TaxID=2905677 RepID=UPI001FA784B1|nr:family 16 glycoside hydrolase [Pontibacter liquoris]